MSTVNNARDRLLGAAPNVERPVNIEELARELEETLRQNAAFIATTATDMQEFRELAEDNDKQLTELRNRSRRVNKPISDISFWTPVAYAEPVPFFSVEGMRQWVDAYFWIRGEIAVVESLKQHPDEVVLTRKAQACWKIALKIVSYIILFLPMLVAKCILRYDQPFFIAKKHYWSHARKPNADPAVTPRESSVKIRAKLFSLENIKKTPLE